MTRIFGPAKKGKKTKKLVDELVAGDIAVIAHRDLDELAAESLCARKVKAVINADSSMTGRYPNNGPAKLAAAKIFHLDQLGEEFFEKVGDNDRLTVREDGIWRSSEFLGRGRVVDAALIKEQMRVAEENLTQMLDSFVQNTLDYALKEKELILGNLELPRLKTDFADRHVLVVVRGQSYREDLEAVKHYIDEVRPVLVGVDGGADALLEYGYTPDLVVGDMDSISDQALKKARELVVHAYRDGRAPGMERIRSLNLAATTVQAPGTSEDIAFLLAYEWGAKLIAAIGTHSNMIDFLEKGRKGMASTFLVRLKVGNRLVDARGVSQLYRSRVSGRSLILLTLAAGIPAVALALANPTVRHIFGLIAMRLRLVGL
ncbi:putative cytokinetic ring protein SteA [Dethiobacter alkaliphilus]|uniref:putative cytokinetic ring protein SteA n=1 Tax=Dethiobacter alkaliphilus TaxID=427926 RepID=UPI0022273B24|nr:putative cytokinetic ring protein SteA [Dethiobacter alkaliphilus]MCW3490252.1 putative cytokinetic ring protein SteA [Dethiobacter alkaliphilus]